MTMEDSMTKEQNIMISETGYSKGWGSDKYKNVYGLTANEKKNILEGRVVLITGCPKSGGGNGTGTTVRVVISGSKGKFYHRVPSDEILEQAGIEE